MPPPAGDSGKGSIVTNPSATFGIYRWGWGFSTNQDFNGDIALIACFAACWTPAMVRRWNADPFGFLRPWNEVPALMGSAPPATPPSTGTGVVTFLMGWRRRPGGQWLSSLQVAFDGEPEAGVQSIGTGVVNVTTGDYFELIARQTSGSTKNVAADELTCFGIEVVE